MVSPDPREPLDQEPESRSERAAGGEKPSWFVGPDQGAFVPDPDEVRPSIPTFGQAAPEAPIPLFPGRDDIDTGELDPAFRSDHLSEDPDAAPEEGGDPAEEEAAPGIEFLDETVEAPKHFKPQWAIEPEAPPPLPVSRRILQRLATDRQTQLLVLLGVLLVVAVVSLGSRNSGLTSIHSIRRDAAGFDGRTVKVRGRIGDVFPMGASYAFNLHQGRDTIVVFTRQRVPVAHEQVVIEGSVSTGYLEGLPRAALFEAPH